MKAQELAVKYKVGNTALDYYNYIISKNNTNIIERLIHCMDKDSIRGFMLYISPATRNYKTLILTVFK